MDWEFQGYGWIILGGGGVHPRAIWLSNFLVGITDVRSLGLSSWHGLIPQRRLLQPLPGERRPGCLILGACLGKRLRSGLGLSLPVNKYLLKPLVFTIVLWY